MPGQLTALFHERDQLLALALADHGTVQRQEPRVAVVVERTGYEIDKGELLLRELIATAEIADEAIDGGLDLTPRLRSLVGQPHERLTF